MDKRLLRLEILEEKADAVDILHGFQIIEEARLSANDEALGVVLSAGPLRQARPDKARRSSSSSDWLAFSSASMRSRASGNVARRGSSR